ncbi:alpha/beta fold hydrolase [Actinomycetospora sp. TBRC 11914]|uniref:alpha/beta fold hydrolase n=1 Tax=Actinomycetospora sp. TBRC 11914 TaxID=2729387 RepID=UPI0028978B1E|nr:alpha/beta fold hydrolase [Actinomycetospora sp. TBRC 11914]
MRRVQVGEDVALAVQDLGSGPPVVFVSGFGLDQSLWDRQVRALSGGHRTVCVVQRGHGDSDAPLEGYELDGLVDDLAAVLDHLVVGAATVVGHSLGGLVAFGLAARRPDLVHALVLVSSNGVRASRSDDFPFGPPPEPTLDAVIADEEADRAGARRRGLACFGREPGTATVDWLFGVSLRMPSWAAVGCYRTLLTTDQLASIAGVGIPVLQIAGTADPVMSLKGARWLAGRLASARLVELDGCGHFPMLEAPAEFDAALTAFLADHPPIVERAVPE